MRALFPNAAIATRICILFFLSLASLGSCAVLTYVRYGIVSSEGYPTWEASRNYIFRRGEVQILLPQNFQISEVMCSGAEKSIRIDENRVRVEIGYTGCEIIIAAVDREHGGERRFLFPISKLNNWNRMSILAVNGIFHVYENGVWVETFTDVTL